jgi:Ca2+-binding EF-hand superfamily protein
MFGVSAMLFAVGAASIALDAVKSLTSSVSSSSQSTGFGQANPFEISSSTATSASATEATGFSAGSQISPSTMSALLAAQDQSSTGSTTTASTSPSDALQNLFSQIDANGDGQITKSEFENALGAGGTNLAQADNVFSKLDTNGDGSVSLNDLSSALKGAGHHGHHVANSDGSSDSNGNSSSNTSGSSADPLLQAMQAAFSTSTTNSNGLAASLIPADLSKVTTTSLGASGSATSSYNSIEQMIQRQMQAMSFSATPLSFNA